MKVFSLSLLVAPVLSESLYVSYAGYVYKSAQEVPSVKSWTNLGKWRDGPWGTPYHITDPWTDISCNKKDQCWAISKDSAGNGLLWYVDASRPTSTTGIGSDPLWTMGIEYKWEEKYCQYQGSKWNPKSVHTAHKDGSVFVIDSKNDIYKLQGPEATEWEKLLQWGQTEVQGVHVAPLEYGRAYIVRPSGELFQYVQNHWPDETYHEDITGLPHGATKIAYCPPYELEYRGEHYQRPKTLYALDKNGRMWTHGKGFSNWSPRSFSWAILPGHAVDIVCKGDEDVFHVGSDGGIYKLNYHKNKHFVSRGWEKPMKHGDWWKITGTADGCG